MPLMQRGLAAMSGRVPKVLSPKGHAIADYVTMGGFVLITAMCWKHNKRAAVGAIACGVAQAANVLLTDFPGGVAKIINFPTHGKIDMGLAALCSSMPGFMGFKKEDESRYLNVMGLNIAAVTALTDFGTKRPRRGLFRRAA